MVRFARWCFVHRKAVLAGWLIALIGFFAVGLKVGAKYAENDSLPGTDSTQAQSVLQADYPAQAGDSDQIVVQAKQGTLRSPAAETAVTSMLARVAKLPYVRSVTSPYGPGGQISKDGTIGLATVNLTAQANSVPNSAVQTLISTAQSADRPLLNVQLGGAAIENVAVPSGDFTSVMLGIVLALVVLFFAFRRSVVAALLPLISALVAIGVGYSIITVVTHAISIASWVPVVAIFVSLGVGVDYALFIVSRHRNGLLAGQTPEDAAVAALNTSGRAVLLAGLTVCVALLGLFALQISSLYGVAVAVALVVALTMVASLTLLPAMLGFLGPKVLRRAERRMLVEQGRQVEQAGGFWLRWAEGLGRRPLIPAFLALAVIVILAIPVLSFPTALLDSSTDPPSSTTYQAYQLLAKGFGPGFNGPLDMVGQVNSPADQARFAAFLTAARGEPGVAGVTAPQLSPNGKTEVAEVFPTTGGRDHHRARPAAGRRTPGRSGQHAGDPHRRHHGGQPGLFPGDQQQAAHVRGRGCRAVLPAARHRLPQPAHPAGGVDHERPLLRRGAGLHDGRIPVRLGQVAARVRHGSADHGVDPGADVRHPVRPVHRLRGLPHQPHARRVEAVRGQQARGDPGPGRDRPG